MNMRNLTKGQLVWINVFAYGGTVNLIAHTILLSLLVAITTLYVCFRWELISRWMLTAYWGTGMAIILGCFIYLIIMVIVRSPLWSN